MTSMAEVDAVYASLGYPKDADHKQMLARLKETTEIAANSAGVIMLLNVLWDAHYQLCQSAGNGEEKVVMADDFFLWLTQYEDHEMIKLEKVLEKSVVCSCQRPYIDGRDCFSTSIETHYRVLLSDSTIVAYAKAIFTWYSTVDNCEILYSDLDFSSVLY